MKNKREIGVKQERKIERRVGNTWERSEKRNEINAVRLQKLDTSYPVQMES